MVCTSNLTMCLSLLVHMGLCLELGPHFIEYTNPNPKPNRNRNPKATAGCIQMELGQLQNVGSNKMALIGK